MARKTNRKKASAAKPKAGAKPKGRKLPKNVQALVGMHRDTMTATHPFAILHAADAFDSSGRFTTSSMESGTVHAIDKAVEREERFHVAPHVHPREVGAPDYRKFGRSIHPANPSNNRELVGMKSPFNKRGEPVAGSLAPEPVTKYYDSLDDPRERSGVRIPGTPTGRFPVATCVCQTTATFSFAVTANTCSQVSLGGHGIVDHVEELGNVSKALTISATNYTLGPYTDTSAAALAPIAGAVTTGVNLGTWYAASNTGASAPIPWDNAFPVPQTADNPDTQRARLVSQVFEWVNTSELVNQGGSVISVQPHHELNIVTGADQGVFGRYPTYCMQEVAEGKINYLPAPEDLSFFHTSSGLLAATDFHGMGIFIFFNAPAATAQTYTCSITSNWEIAGDNVEALCAPAVNVPGAVSSISDSIEAMRNAGLPGADKSSKCDHVLKAASMPPATREIHGLPSDDEGILGMATKMLGKLGPEILSGLIAL